ncbi:MAG TPA: DUF2784 domain-containing protein [Vicinamibacterales bacterium]
MPLELLNAGFFVVHSLWMVFNCVGWIWRRTRPWHLLTMALTAASWLLLGIRYGWGYCPCTDWHWRVREQLGYVDPPSYTELLIEQLLRVDVSTRTADVLTVAVFAVAAILTVILNLRDWRRANQRVGHRAG